MGNCGGKGQAGDIVLQPSDLPSQSSNSDSTPVFVQPSNESATPTSKQSNVETKFETTDSNPLESALPAPSTETSEEVIKKDSETSSNSMRPTKKKLAVATNQSMADSDDNRVLGVSQPPTPQQIAAAQRIQRLARNKSAWRIAEVEREWKVHCTGRKINTPLTPHIADI